MRASTRRLCMHLVLLACACASPAPPDAPSAPVPLPAPGLEPRTRSHPDASPRPAMLRLLESTRVTLQVKDADLQGLLLGLGRDSPLDIVVEPGVQGTVTADLRDVSLVDVLDEVVVGRGYRYAVTGNLLRIFRSDRQTRTYRVNYPDYKRTGSSELALAGFIGAAASAVETTNSSGGQDASLSSVVTTQTTDLWDELERALRSIVFGSEDVQKDETGDAEAAPGSTALRPRRVIVSRQSGLVTVTAESSVLDEVENYLDEMDASLERQVLIDAEIIEITLDDDLDIGADFEVAPDVAGSVFSRMITPGLREATIVQSLAPILSQGGVEFGLARQDLGAIIRAIATQTDVRVVSTPRIATLNNHQAIMKVVRNEVFFVAEVQTVITDQVVQQTTEFQPQVIPVGVTLDVTPQVSESEEITLHVRPSVSEIVSVEPQPSSDPDLPQTGSLPVVDLREADSVLRVRDGSTIVIGGLVRSREFEQKRRIPFFGDIPVLGNAFRRTVTEERRTELVIFLTPTVLDAPRIMRTAEESGSRLDEVDELRTGRGSWRWWRRPFGRSYGAKR